MSALESVINSLERLIPCDECAEHFAEQLKNNPIPFNSHSRIEMLKWLIELHDNVNEWN